MALNSSGQLSLGGATTGQSVDLELGQGSTTTISFNDTNVRTLTGTSAGTALTLPTGFYGKSYRTSFNIVISSSVNNYLAAISKVSGYVAGRSDVTFTINSGVVIGSASTGSYSFTVDSSWASGDTVTIVNNGVIIGAGGTGGAGGNAASGTGSPGGTGLSGGPALSVARAITFTNTSGVAAAGAGGGGGGGGTSYNTGKGSFFSSGGGGGGGGRGNIGGSGGSGGLASSTGSQSNGSAGNAGATLYQGTGGGGGANFGYGSGASGGAGGILGSAGSTGGTATGTGGNGAGGSGGAAGALLVGKSFVNSGAGITTGTFAGGQS